MTGRGATGGTRLRSVFMEQLRASLVAAEQGTYGTCERCGGPIDPERLEARPQARTCIGCARRASARR